MAVKDCELLGAFDECTGVALSATREGEDGVITGILEFASAEAGAGSPTGHQGSD